MSTTYDNDPETTTFAVAWASSPLGEPESGPDDLWANVENLEGSVEPAKPKSTAKQAVMAVGLAFGIAAAAAVGLTVLDFGDSSESTVVEPHVSAPGIGVPAADQVLPTPEAVSGSTNVSSPTQVVVPQGSASASNPTAGAPQGAPAPNGPSSGTGSGPTNVGSTPAGGPDGPVVTINIPPLPLPPLEPEPQPDPPSPNPTDDVTLQQAPQSDPPNVQPSPPQTVTPANPPGEKPIIKIGPKTISMPEQELQVPKL